MKQFEVILSAYRSLALLAMDKLRPYGNSSMLPRVTLHAISAPVLMHGSASLCGLTLPPSRTRDVFDCQLYYSGIQEH